MAVWCVSLLSIAACFHCVENLLQEPAVPHSQLGWRLRLAAWSSCLMLLRQAPQPPS